MHPEPTPTRAFPIGLLAGALVFWGVGNATLVFAIPMALVLEIAPLVPWRWRFESKDFHRLVDLSAVLFVATALYQFDQRAVHGVYGVLMWLPALLYVLMLGQRYSERGRIGLSSLFLSVRRALARGEMHHDPSIDFAAPYFSACLISGAAGAVQGEWQFPALAGLAGWGLWMARPARTRVLAWVAAVVAVAALGVGGQKALLETRSALEPIVMQFFRDYIASRRDPFRSQTAIGELGELKASGRIEMRVRPDATGRAPALLREATYRRYRGGIWLTGREPLVPLRPTDGGLTWTVGGRPAAAPAVAGLSRHLPRGRGLLALPEGAWQLRSLGVETLEQHRFGAVKVVRGPELVDFEVLYDPATVLAPAPDAVDTRTPERLRPLLHGVLSELGVDGSPPRRVLARLVRHFARDFRYALDLSERNAGTRPLQDFLVLSRAGHCEYFATATVLLLRAAGVPARYVTGFAVQEWSELDEAFVVRRRDAHAWVIAHVDGNWQVVDTTPAGWPIEDAADAPWWTDAYDLGSWLAHRFAQWRWRTADDSNSLWFLFVVVPLVGVLLWRLRGQRVTVEPSSTRQVRPAPLRPSAFDAVVAAFEGAERGPQHGEALGAWLRRLATPNQLPGGMAALGEALALHQRLRFDPAGLPADEQGRLRQIVEAWLADHGRGLSA